MKDILEGPKCETEYSLLSCMQMNRFERQQASRSLDACYQKLEQLERLRSENTPHCPMITHTIDSYQTPSKKIWK